MVQNIVLYFTNDDYIDIPVNLSEDVTYDSVTKYILNELRHNDFIKIGSVIVQSKCVKSLYFTEDEE